jgi:hypothetical protein
MKISRKSWHYRLVDFFRRPAPAEYANLGVTYRYEAVNTCEYFRSLGFVLLLAVAFSPFLLAFGLLWGLAQLAQRAGRFLHLSTPAFMHHSFAERSAKKEREAAKREALFVQWQEQRRAHLCSFIEYED